MPLSSNGLSSNGMSLDRRMLLQGAGALGMSSIMPSPTRAAAPLPGAADIQALIDQRVAARHLPGAIVSIASGPGPARYVFGGTLDFDSTTCVDENTLWRLASMTKPITGMAAMLLIHERRLALDQPVADFIPRFAHMQVIRDPATTQARPAARPITIRHLLTHTSGILNDPVGTIADAYRRLGVANTPSGGADTFPPPRDREEWIDRIAQVPLAADPGTKWLYSPNPDILARVIEIIAGMPFDLFLDQRLFGPLDMRSSFFQVPERDKTRLMTMYALRDGALVAIDRGATSALLKKPPIPRASGGLVSSARDYDRFMAMVVGRGVIDGRRVFPAAAVALGTPNLLPPGTDMSAYTSRTGFDGFGALGMVTVGGPRPGTYGWGGSSGTTGFCNPQLESRWGSYTNIGASDFGRKAMTAAGISFSHAIMPGGAERPPA